MGLGDLFRGSRRAARRAVDESTACAERLGSAEEQAVVANLVLALWHRLAGGFRNDESGMEQPKFQADVAAVADRVDALPADAAPDPALCRHLLFVLDQQVPARIDDLHARIDDLAAACRSRDKELNVLKLGTSWQSDELERCRSLIAEALRGRETILPMSPDGARPLISDLLAALFNVQRPPPLVRAHETRRQTERGSEVEPAVPDANEAADPQSGSATVELAAVRRILTEVLDGSAGVPKLARLIEDQVLAKRLAELAGEHQRFKDVLMRIGLLPPGG